MVEYNSTVNINPLYPWLCVKSLPSPRSNHSILALDVIKCNYIAYETRKIIRKIITLTGFIDHYQPVTEFVFYALITR